MKESKWDLFHREFAGQRIVAAELHIQLAGQPPFRHCRFYFGRQLMAIGIHGSFKTSNHVVAEFQIHQAEVSSATPALTRDPGRGNCRLSLPPIGRRFSLNSLDGLEGGCPRP